MKHVVLALLTLHLVACSSASNGSGGDGGPGASGGAGGRGGSGGAGGLGATGGSGGLGATGGSGGLGATGGSGGLGATGGSGGGSATCGPGDLDCICPGGNFICQNDRTTCVCPRECTYNEECGQDAICLFYDGNCGGAAHGYCQTIATAPGSTCIQTPVCGCDGNLYASSCDALAAHVSPSAAATSDCAARPLACSDSASTPSCYPNQYCTVWNTGGSISGWCAHFNGACAQPSCDCVSYNASACHCEVLSSGIVRLTCNS
jgi:hypothetical protein